MYDRISDDDLNNLPEGETYYLGIKLNFDTDSPPFSRADLEEAVAPVKEDTLETGTDEEHKVALTAKNFVILFKKDDAGNKDKLLGIYDFWDTEQNTNIDENEKDKYPPNAEAKYTYVARIPVKDLDWEGACLVVLNGKPKIYDNLKEEFGKKVDVATLDDVLKAVWAEKNMDEDPRDIGYADKNHKFFTMTNSVYYDDKNKLHIAEEFNAKEHVRKTYAEAKREPITVYVERMVAKFDFKLKERKDGNIFYPGKDEDDPSKVSTSIIMFDGFDENNGAPKHKARDWRIEVTGWNVNALETQSYIFKKLPEYGKLNDYLKDFSWWNDAGNYRSYWCEDPHYDFTYNDQGEKTDKRWRYSWQYRQSYDYVLDDYHDIEEDNALLLRNYSFDDLNLGKPDMKKFSSEKEYMDSMKCAFNNKVVYTPENTYDANEVLKDFQKEYPGLDMRDELLAGTHILVGAEFQIDVTGFDKKALHKYFVDDGAKFDTVYKTPNHLYRDRVGYYYLSERECLASLVHDFNQLLESQDKMVFVYYDWSGNDKNTPKLVADTHTEPGETTKYSLYYKKNKDGEWQPLTEKDILDENIFGDDDLSMPVANLRRGDGKRLPWIEKLMDEDRLAIGKNVEDPILYIYNYEPVEGGDEKPTVADENHIKSLLYEWLGAIEHFKQGRMYYAIGVVNNPPIKEGKTKHYGVVRNNWYRFTLEDIKGIGIPVDKDDQPIVPERDGLNDQVNHSVQILNWHVEESNVDILP